MEQQERDQTPHEAPAARSVGPARPVWLGLRLGATASKFIVPEC